MKKILVVIDLNDHEKQLFLDRCTNVSITFKNRKEVTEQIITEHDAIIGNLTPKLLINANNIQWVHLESAGVEKYLDIYPNITITNSTGAYGEAMAEYMIGALFVLFKRIHEYIKAKNNRSWDYLGQVHRVANAKVLAVGLGDIGSTFAVKMNALGAKVYGVKKTIIDKPQYIEDLYTFDTIDEILGEMDVVALSLPATKETHHFFNYERLKKFKKGAVLINVGRGITIDTDALIKVLSEEHLLGAYLDVVDPEPLPKDSPLWQFENVLITPHVSGNYSMPYTLERVIGIAIDNINKYSKDEELENIIDREKGYK